MSETLTSWSYVLVSDARIVDGSAVWHRRLVKHVQRASSLGLIRGLAAVKRRNGGLNTKHLTQEQCRLLGACILQVTQLAL